MKANLPIHITSANQAIDNDVILFMISGDAGWTDFDQQVANGFAEKGIPAIGLNALKYFWEKKTPRQITSTVLRLIKKYSTLWKKDQIILVGFSFGADVMPFVYNLLPERVRKRVASVGLLSPSKNTDFEIHVADMLNWKLIDRETNVPAEIAKISGTNVICFFGKDENDIPVNDLPKDCRIVYLNGGHHYEDSFDLIYQNVMH